MDLYHKTACHKAVINEKVLQSIIKVLSPGFFSNTVSERRVVCINVVNIVEQLERGETRQLRISSLGFSLFCQQPKLI